MLSRFDYARDKRSKESFREYLAIGKHNQVLAIHQFLIDRYQAGYGNYEYEELEDDDNSQSEKDWDYSPDYRIHTPAGSFYLEVKVQMRPLGREIDFKINQINKLIELKGYILYCLKNKWIILKPDVIAKINNIVESEKLNKEKAYRIPTHNFEWTLWSHSPEFMTYDSKYPKK